jgi:pimeloyl-ACP methyl ester carboxylesterase
MDLRGLGESKSSGPFSMDRYADDVAAVLDTLRIPHAVIAGLSMGGYVAFAFWRRHRERVRAMVLSNTRAAADMEEVVARRRHLIEIAKTQGSTGVANAQIAGLVGKTTREKRPDIYDALHRMMAQAPTDGVIGAIHALIDRPDSTATCATIDVPTLVISGDEDVITPPKEASRLSAAIRGSRLEILQGAGHLSNVERPAAFNTVVSEFLASILYN